MKRLSLVSCFLFLLSLRLYAVVVEVPGELMIDENDTRGVTFILPVLVTASRSMLDFETMQLELQYIDDNHQVVTVTPGMIREIRFAYVNEVIRMRSMMYRDSRNNLTKQFLRLRMEGDLNVYSLYWHIYTRNYLYNPEPVREDYLIQRRKAVPIFCGENGFAKRLSKYFEDCPFLSDLIARRQLTQRDVINIAMYYNRTCGDYGNKFNGEKIPGKIITDKDTTDVTLRLYLETSQNIAIIPIQDGISYVDKDGNVKAVKPGDCKEVRFKQAGDYTRMLSRMFMRADGSIEYKFLKLAMDGPLKIFEYYVAPQYSRVDSKAEYSYKKTYTPKRIDYAFQKGEKSAVKLCETGVNFRDEMMAYFKDCPKLARLIERGDLSKENVFEMAMFYKESCGKK
jgi:hypothetical protein